MFRYDLLAVPEIICLIKHRPIMEWSFSIKSVLNKVS